MALIFESSHFIVEAPDKPHVHVDRRDGGHVKITPKERVEDRTQLSVEVLTEFAILGTVVSQAMMIVLNEHNIDVERINYQENGNFNPILHAHLYGRALSAPNQEFGTVLQFPPHQAEFSIYIKDNEPLNAEDIFRMGQEIESLLRSTKFRGCI